VSIITKVVSSNPIHGEVYSIQHNVIKFVSNLRQVVGFLWFPPSISWHPTNHNTKNSWLKEVADIPPTTTHKNSWRKGVADIPPTTTIGCQPPLFNHFFFILFKCTTYNTLQEGRCGCDCIAIGFTTTCVISIYHHWNCEFEPLSWRGVLNTLCGKVCQWLATGQWFSLGTLVPSTNKTDSHNNKKIL
jgi:hypothetical protein